MKKLAAVLTCVLLLLTAFAACSSGEPGSTPPAQTSQSDSGAESPKSEGSRGETMRFIMIPVSVHAWFDEVHKGSEQMANFLSSELGYDVVVEYHAPQSGDIAEQNTILQQAAATKPDGIAICPIDIEGSRAIIEEIQAQGIPVTLINQMPPAGFTGLMGVGNDFKEQGEVAAKRMVELLGGKGKVAVMHGLATANTHIERYEAELAIFAQYPDIEVIDAGFDNDDVETGQQLAAAIIASNPDLNGFVCVDAAGPVGIANAVKESGKQDQIKVVGMDDVIEILEAIDSGIMDSSSSTKPLLQGKMLCLMMWQGARGNEMPKFVDTGVGFISQENVGAALDAAQE